ncbi:MAG: DUF3299 domain-containing protein [Stenotrophomonas sp.]
MNPSVLVSACALLCALLAGCGRAGVDTASQRAGGASVGPSSSAADAPLTRWDALMPEADSFQRAPPQIGVSRGSGMGSVGGLMDDSGSGSLPGQAIDHSSPLRAQQFGSAAVVEAVDGRVVDLDGYVVPLGINDAGQVDEALFVPFYGACIHVPPPPPNQIIHLTLTAPITLGALWDPYRLSGRLRIKHFEADIASASYDAAAATLTVISR